MIDVRSRNGKNITAVTNLERGKGRESVSWRISRHNPRHDISILQEEVTKDDEAGVGIRSFENVQLPTVVAAVVIEGKAEPK